ncbi:MAG: ClpX C4-type zinc finger protein [Enterocloster clostridioformis]
MYCSFCGKSQNDVFRMIAEPSEIFICDRGSGIMCGKSFLRKPNNRQIFAGTSQESYFLARSLDCTNSLITW